MSKYTKARKRLFKTGKPDIRPLDVEKDFAVLWAAYRLGSFDMPDLTQEQFTDHMIDYIARYHWAWMIEDHNAQYKDRKGPVGMMVARYDNWAMEPHFNPFKWATDRNKMKAVVGFLQMSKYEKGVGVVNINSLERDKDFFHHLKKNYGVVYYVGKIPRGDYGLDKYLFYGRGGSYFKGAKQWAA